MSAIPTYIEQELVTLLRNRDNKAFGYLYDRYSGALYSIILQILNDDTELASDVLQEVFVNIWRKIESYDSSKGRLFTWMLNIARNASIDTLRSRTYQNDRKNLSIDNPAEDVLVALITQVNVDNIGFRKVLNQLKEEQRLLIELAYFRGYTHEEIAEMEKLPLGTVKTRIRSALLQLRGLLK